jgi:flagellar hook assembly protein FlgD
MPTEGLVTLRIYDITGREVTNSNEYKTAGSYSFTFDGTNFASGLYIYKVEFGNYSDTKKMVLVK